MWPLEREERENKDNHATLLILSLALFYCSLVTARLRYQLMIEPLERKGKEKKKERATKAVLILSLAFCFSSFSRSGLVSEIHLSGLFSMRRGK